MRPPSLHASRLALVIVCLTVTLVAQQTCVPPPVAIPIVNVALSKGKVRRGASIKVGEPEREFAFLPKWDNNNTFLFGPTCIEEDFIDSEDACITFRGGIFQSDDSNTFNVPNSSFVPQPERWPKSTYNFFTEKLTLNNNNITLDSFALARPLDIKTWDLQAYDPQNFIGMGPGSTLLSALRNGHHIASRASGFFWGLDGVSQRDQSAGSFVLGGYDKAKTVGDGHTQLLSNRADCPSRQMVTIRDMVLNFRGGRDVSIFPQDNGGTALLACLVPELPVVMELPLEPYFSNLLTAIGNQEVGRSTGIDWWNVVLNSTNIYDGDLTLKLDSGLAITIPNRQLIVPERRIDDQGAISVNSSRPVIRINSLQSSTAQAIPKIGRYFFTSAYLMSNEDAGQFTLWQANPTSAEDLVTVDEDNNSIVPAASGVTTCVSASSAASSPTSSSSPSSVPGDDAGRLSTGAIAGIAAGAAVAVTSLVSLLTWRFLRKKRSKAESVKTGPFAESPQWPKQDLRSPSQSYYSPVVIHRELSGGEQRLPLNELEA